MIRAIVNFANGDARSALSTLEMVVLNGEIDEGGAVTVTVETLEQCTSRKSLLYDKKGEEHYNLIRAVHGGLLKAVVMQQNAVLIRKARQLLSCYREICILRFFRPSL